LGAALPATGQNFVAPSVKLLEKYGYPALLQKRFVVSAVKSFFVSVSPADTILRIQKIDYFSYRLFPADTQNQFSKIKKIRA
jgi:hypothetical protein